MSIKDVNMKKRNQYILISSVKANDKTFVRKARGIGLFLCVLLILMAVLTSLWLGLGKQDYDTSKITYISSGDTFVEEIAKNSYTTSSQKRFELNGDFTITQEHLEELSSIQNLHAQSGAWFYGELDGKGHTITIEGEMQHPIFDQVVEGATIKQLCIRGAHLTGQKSEGHSISVLSMVNHGTLENIELRDITINIGVANTAAAIVGYNFGTITKCVVQADVSVEESFISENQKINGVWGCRFGSVAANNLSDGKIEGAIISIDFPQNFVVLSMLQYNTNGDRNLLVGYGVAAWQKDELVKNIYVVDGDYTSTAIDFVESTSGSMISSITSRFLSSTNFIDWKNAGWNFNDGGGLPYLSIL